MSWLIPGNTPPHICYPTEFGRSDVVVKRHERNYGDLPAKLIIRVQPFKITQGHRNRHGSIGYL